jgi:DNA-binding MarR family transcriptional regulator/N-acetylglutamate synthase-like GNAT family acetyltransferase
MRKPKLKSNPDKSTEETVESIRSFNRFYTKRIGVLSGRLLDSAFSLPEVRVMFELSSSGALSVTQLAENLDVDRGYMSRVTTSLHRRRIIARSKSSSDGRVRFLELSKEGKRAFAILDRRSSRQVEQMLGSLTQDDQSKIVAAMTTIQGILEDGPTQRRVVVMRPHRSGDIGWIVERHGALYNHEYDFDVTFEALVAEILAKLTKNFNSKMEQIWIAEVDGRRAGSIVLARAKRTTCQLRLFLVEPWARGYSVGRALIQECIRFARAAGYKDMILWTQSILSAAGHLYKEAGFEVISEEEHKSFGHDLVAQVWRLKL